MSRRGKDGGERGGPSKRFFVALLGLAGLGLGVWIFRSKRKRR